MPRAHIIVRSLAYTIVKALLKSVLMLTIVIIVAVGSVLIYLSFDKEDAFFVLNAELNDANYLRKADAELRRDPRRSGELAVYAHRLKPGRGTILPYREYSEGFLGLSDDESYRKLTIWIDSPPPRGSARFALGREAIAVFVRGGSAWPERGCSGYLTSGTVDIERVGRGYQVSVNGVVDLLPWWGRSDCDKTHLHLKYTAREIEFTGLTPWLGIRGDHPYDETYRRN